MSKLHSTNKSTLSATPFIMPKTKKTSFHPKKGEPKNAPVTRAHANTSPTADTASTHTGAARLATSEVQNKMMIMGHQISFCHVPVVRSFFTL